MSEQITITKLLYDSLQENSKWLQCLRAEGVHEWSGYDAATARYREFGQMKRECERRAATTRDVDAAAAVHAVEPAVDDTVRAMREAGWSDELLREMGLLQ